MVLNLICIILGIIFIAFFAGFNLDNKCNVNLVFHNFEQVHVFFTILISFAVGMACSLPFALIHRAKKSKALKNKEPKIKKEKKSLLKKSEPEATSETSSTAETPAEAPAPAVEAVPETTAENSEKGNEE